MSNSLISISQPVADLLRAHEQTVTVAESSTGGLISAALLAVPGASNYFVAGSVVYTMRSRKRLLGISREDIDGLEPLTEPMAARFAAHAREQMSTTWGVCELGAAGPSGTRYGHPPGISVIGIDGPICRTVSIETGSSDREANMWAFTEKVFQVFEQVLQNQASAST
jgi:PncC family amidohydrolase